MWDEAIGRREEKVLVWRAVARGVTYNSALQRQR
ncbi:hypothetical protein COLO4_37305 [Corchorus olitorius]|uniref:Uncharacterized protein n=1 Tax=Corchorus olitorius TaxID=93759 RepID=A0A1R3G2G3_9ROSI|nr:hypothetical protein COLO4_37305 [Corchorus olitorius]